ncbi:MAG: homoserine dehydrogenase [Bacteroidia bacterium]|nr:homoserine dehydrogenase [Bacteroidia bacterium]
MNTKKLKIGLFGFGCVGHGLYEVLQQTPGLDAEIKTIVVKQKNKSRRLAPEWFSYDKSEILNDAEINLVVELIDDPDAAFEIVKQALCNGKAVVSANKKMIAEHFEELLELQKQFQTPFLYEAAVCASIPIIRNLEEYYDNDLLRSIEGIVNGSTNYILSKTASENLSYQQALQQAQELGYAESNPRLDTGGFDAKFKLLLLIAHAFGIVLQPEQIFHQGINKLGELELNYAREKGLKIKLKARAFKNEAGKVCAFVLPEFVSKNDKFYQVDEVYNALQIEGCFADKQFFVGRGAGAYPTASAVLSDISALRYNYRYEYKKRQEDNEMEASENIFLRVLLRHPREASDEVRSKFLDTEELYKNKEQAYTIGIITLAELQSTLTTEDVSAVLMDLPNSAEVSQYSEKFGEIAWLQE